MANRKQRDQQDIAASIERAAPKPMQGKKPAHRRYSTSGLAYSTYLPAFMRPMGTRLDVVLKAAGLKVRGSRA